MSKTKKSEKKNKISNLKIKNTSHQVAKKTNGAPNELQSKVKKTFIKSGIDKNSSKDHNNLHKVVDNNKKAADKQAKANQNKINKKLKKKLNKTGKLSGDENIPKPQHNHATKTDEVPEEPLKALTTTPKGKAKPKNKKIKSLDEKEKTTNVPGSPEQTVFVGNLPTNTKRVQISKLFAPYGKVLSIRFRTANGKVIFKHKMRKETASLNAYVVLNSVEAVAKALELNGTQFKDQHLRVMKTEKTQDEYNPQTTVFVGNLKYSATDEKLHDIFSSCGEIEYVRTLQSADKNGCRGVAYVCFKNTDAVGLALELNGTMLDERPINVERYSIKKLGAKEKRDSENNILDKGKEKKVLKNKMQAGKKQSDKFGGALKKSAGNPKENFSGAEKKKSEFRGVKSEVLKKKQKKKTPSQMKKLASKIAPKE